MTLNELASRADRISVKIRRGSIDPAVFKAGREIEQQLDSAVSEARDAYKALRTYKGLRQWERVGRSRSDLRAALKSQGG